MASDRRYERWEAEEQREAEEYARRRQARRARMLARKRRRRRKLIRMGILAAAVIVVLILVISAIRGTLGNPVRRELTVEAGTALPDARDFLRNAKSKKEITLVTDISGISLNHVSTTDVVLTVGEKEYTSRLKIVDTVPPEAEASPVSISAGMELEPQELVKNTVDETDLTFAFEEAPENTTLGAKETTVLVTDEGGNQIRVTTQFSVVNDTEAPVIEGVKPLTTVEGVSVDYTAEVTATDNIDKAVDVRVDTGEVDLSKAGVYNVWYRATDNAGNAAEEGTIIVVDPMTEDWVDPAEVLPQAEKILEGIFTDEMTEKQKVRAIFSYVRENLWYTDSHKAESWTACAQQGFNDHGGDSYIYAGMSRALLTAAGIQNLPIERTDPDDPERNGYRWNLVYCGGGWYHFDSTTRRDGTSIFMWTDEQLDTYSVDHKNSHVRVKGDYPATPATEFSMDWEQ